MAQSGQMRKSIASAISHFRRMAWTNGGLSHVFKDFLTSIAQFAVDLDRHQNHFTANPGQICRCQSDLRRCCNSVRHARIRGNTLLRLAAVFAAKSPGCVRHNVGITRQIFAKIAVPDVILRDAARSPVPKERGLRQLGNVFFGTC